MIKAYILYKKGRLLEENHYPHGLTIRSGASNPVPTLEGYQGRELQDEAGMELYDFHARQYDPQIGRFWGIDPADQFPSGYIGMGNNPANMIDPDGMYAFGGGSNSLPSRTDFENADSRRWGARENYWNSAGEEFSAYDWGAVGGSSGSGQGEEDIPTEVINAANGNHLGNIHDNSPGIVTIVELPFNLSEDEASAQIVELNKQSGNVRNYWGKLIQTAGLSFDVPAFFKFYDQNAGVPADVISGFPGGTAKISNMSNIKLDGKPYTLMAEKISEVKPINGLLQPTGPSYFSGDGRSASLSSLPEAIRGNMSAHLHQISSNSELTLTLKRGGISQGFSLPMYTLPSPADRAGGMYHGRWDVVVSPTKLYIHGNGGVTIQINR